MNNYPLTVCSEGRTITIHKTHRSYAYDLADAYNAAMPAREAEAFEWIVDKNGALRLDFRRNHSDRISTNAKQRTKSEQRKALERQNNPQSEWL